MKEQVERSGWTYQRLCRYSQLRPSVAELVDARIHGNKIKNLEWELTVCERTNQMLDMVEDTLQGDHTPKQLESILTVMLHQDGNQMEGRKQLHDAMFILNKGDEILKRLCWTYASFPSVFEEKYAVDRKAFLTERYTTNFPYLSLKPLMDVKNAGLLLDKNAWNLYKTVLNGRINDEYLHDPHREDPFNVMITSDVCGSLVQEGRGIKKALQNVEMTLYPPILKTLSATK